MKLINKSRRTKRGAALVEYGLIVAGVALVAAVAVSVFGHKTAGMIAASAHVLPGADATDNGSIAAGHVVAVTGGGDATTQIGLDETKVGDTTMGNSLGVDSTGWVVDPNN